VQAFSRNLPALTGLRFFAAFEVVVFHLGRWESWPLPRPIRALAGAGFLAVTLFFVLSGFILTYTYLAPESKKASGLELYLLRLARIYPVYLLGLVIAMPIFLGASFLGGATKELVAAQSAVALFMAQAYVPQWAIVWNPPAWSISVEMFFYIVFPLLAPRLMSCSKRSAMWIAASAWLIAVLLPIAYTIAAPQETPEHHPWRSVIDYFPLARLPDFVVGIVAGRFYLESRTSRPPLKALLALGIGFPVVVVASGVVPELIMHGSLLAPCFAILIYALAFGEGRIARVLSMPPQVLLGEASYALYILHVPIMFWIFFVGEKVVHRKLLEDPVVIVATMLGTVLVSVGVFRWIESPLRRRLRALIQRTLTPPSGASKPSSMV
jgi:peptidoglycan/LPS O-acetylase OafA/YrhL